MEQNTLNSAPSPLQVPTSDTAPAAQLQAVVDLMPNITIFGAKTVLMEWSADNHLRIYEMNFDINQATGIILDTPIAAINKVTGSLNMLTFHVGGRTYRTLFAAMRTAGMGAVGVGVAVNELNASGSSLWINKLKEHSIPVNILGWGKSFAIAIASVVVIVVGVFVVSAISTQ
ncbi:hypothetical protein H7100_03280 [Candidatus Saccharibacteria bacterium]|nr:hypothetical protein [Candidatus Saccharibacteria bacterium]